MTFKHYALIVTISLLFVVGITAMMWEDSKANDILTYVAIVTTVIGVLILFFE